MRLREGLKNDGNTANALPWMTRGFIRGLALSWPDAGEDHDHYRDKARSLEQKESRGLKALIMTSDHRRTRTCNLLVPPAIEAKRATIAPGSHPRTSNFKRFNLSPPHQWRYHEGPLFPQSPYKVTQLQASRLMSLIVA
jgi:hypothetical protein